MTTAERVERWRLENPEKYKAQWQRHNRSEKRRKWLSDNRERLNAYGKKWRLDNRQRLLPKKRADNLRSKYGIDEVWYTRQLAKQDNACAICQRQLKRKLSVDHNHLTGLLRGLLCVVCNTKLGVLEDSDFITKANVYLQEYDTK